MFVEKCLFTWNDESEGKKEIKCENWGKHIDARGVVPNNIICIQIHMCIEYEIV